MIIIKRFVDSPELMNSVRCDSRIIGFVIYVYC